MPEDEKKTGWPKVSIIVVCFNHKHYLEDCLNSIHGQRYPEYEVIFVDNASTDKSADFVSDHFVDVHVIRNDRNVGFGEANNIGATFAKGAYLAFLNPDTRVDPDWLLQLVQALQSSNNAGMATPKILLSKDPEIINACGNTMHFTGLAFCRGMNQPADTFFEMKAVDAVSGAAFVIRKSFFSLLGGFDETFFTYLEDTDLSIRSRLAGKDCLYVPKAIIYHDYHLRFRPNKTYYQERNRYLLLLKNFQLTTLLAMIPALILAELMTWGFSFLLDRKNFFNKFLAYGWILKNLREIIKQRPKVKALRQKSDKDILSKCTHRIPFEQVVGGPLMSIAQCVFGPLFFLSKRLCLLLIKG